MLLYGSSGAHVCLPLFDSSLAQLHRRIHVPGKICRRYIFLDPMLT